MPCTVDLYEGYKWYDSYDLADYLYFNTPLSPLMGEVIKILEEKGFIEELSLLLKNWYTEYTKDKNLREQFGKRLSSRKREKELDPLIQHMYDINFKVTRGILTKEEHEEEERERIKNAEEQNKWKIEYDKKQAINEERIKKRKQAMEEAIVNYVGRELTLDERYDRLEHEVDEQNGKRVTKLYLDNNLILEYID